MPTKSFTTTEKTELPKGFTCECGTFNRFPPYVYAHWDIILVFTCECKRKYIIRRGIALEDK
jgi:hypothetical protein